MKIKALKPKEKRYEVTHKTGLVLVVSTNGRKTWKVNKSVGGKRITERLGDWPQMGIADAVAAMEALTAKNKPVVQQTNERTFGAIFEEWMELKKANVKNWADIEQRMEKDLLPLFKERSFASITPPEVIKALRTGPLARGKAETVRRLCGYLSEMERFAVNSGYAEALKFTALHEVFPNVKHEHFAAPEPAQLPDVLKRLQIEAIRAPLTWAAILIGFYSLLRPGEYCALRWDWIEDDVITVPAEH
ncbi:MAG: integrase arm-type DNA-binding domain-containing protein, partial [Succinivibrio sp.]|nr:integrase arm-type DNA-binding domain-containing protein [Succinivibrio sp.]